MFVFFVQRTNIYFEIYSRLPVMLNGRSQNLHIKMLLPLIIFSCICNAQEFNRLNEVNSDPKRTNPLS